MDLIHFFVRALLYWRGSRCVPFQLGNPLEPEDIEEES